ncbi:MAG: hypothetical protein KAT32_00440 [Candidatus Moranbacteria bacterium]|nr:hypothetical protein [Candidatus Moranbacteria bacterium]
MKKSNAKNISEFNSLEARGWIIVVTSEIERFIDSIIMDFIKINDQKRDFFVNVLLGGDTIFFGAKIKILIQILKNIDKEKKFQNLIENLRKINRIRNIFAHCYSDDVIIYDKNLGGKATKVEEVLFKVSKNSKGDTENVLFKKYLKEFDSYYNEEFRENLKELKSIVKS